MTSNDKINIGNFMPDGYRETIQKGIEGVRRFSGKISLGSGELSSLTEKLKNEVEHADAIVIGAGAGLSTSAGFTYSGERFKRYFSDFALQFGIRDMYSGGFYPFRMMKHVGHGGRDIYILTDMLTLRSLFTTNCTIL